MHWVKLSVRLSIDNFVIKAQIPKKSIFISESDSKRSRVHINLKGGDRGSELKCAEFVVL